MQGEVVLWESKKRLNSTLNEIICITFLTTEHSIPSLIPLMIKAFCKIKLRFSKIKLLSLKQYRNDRWRPWNMATEKMPGFEMSLSLAANPIEVKKICIALEKNRRNERIADIDVHLFDRAKKDLYKIRRLDFIDKLYSF